MARKAHNIHYIYKTTCNVTGRWYVGMHSTSNENDGYMGSGTILRRSIRKYGKDNHIKEILEYCASREELAIRERDIVTKELISDGFCMNLKEGGEGGGFIDEEHKLKFIIAGSKAGSKAFKEKLDNDPEFRNSWLIKRQVGLQKAIDSGKLINSGAGCDWTGKNHSEETKQLISQRMKEFGKGEANSQYGTCWITKDGLNKKVKKEEIDTWTNEGWLKGRK